MQSPRPGDPIGGFGSCRPLSALGLAVGLRTVAMVRQTCEPHGPSEIRAALSSNYSSEKRRNFERISCFVGDCSTPATAMRSNRPSALVNRSIPTKPALLLVHSYVGGQLRGRAAAVRGDAYPLCRADDYGERRASAAGESGAHSFQCGVAPRAANATLGWQSS